jgi:hypothetical protein
MPIDEEYYNQLDQELTDTTPEIDWGSRGIFSATGASGIILERTDMNLAQELARRENLTVSEYISRTLRKELLTAG